MRKSLLAAVVLSTGACSIMFSAMSAQADQPPGVFTVKDSHGNSWVSNGVATQSLATYLGQLGITGNFSLALFAGNGTMGALELDGPIGSASGPASAFAEPFATTATPEPGPWALITMGLSAVLFGRSRAHAKRA